MTRIELVNLFLTKEALYRLSYMGFYLFLGYELTRNWWWGEDLNLRRLSRQIYSLIPLTTREPHPV